MTASWGRYALAARGRDLVRALRAVALCPRCEDRHMRPYPEEPGNFCAQPGCECWCNTREGGLEELRRDGYEED